MQCTAHPDIEARGPCAVCAKNLCDDCATYELESRGTASSAAASCCEGCGRAQEEDASSLSSGLLALVGVGYLATLAVGIVVFKARPFVGGLAAIVAIALGRALSLFVKPITATRRARSVDATASRS
ncbi:MAG: hypothetical protein JWP87_6410 [Labilithrix sp.]|jgi:hypothetical protein|nr:hypothetical protein [Labilithrix sp.]